MLEITLQGAPHKTYTFVYSNRIYDFVGGVPKKVPMPAAIELRRRSEAGRLPKFNFVGMTPVITPIKVEVPKIEQTVTQPRFDKWPS